MTTHNKRPGFTLTEMLVVVAIVLILATFLVRLTLRMQERDNVTRGVNLLQGLLLQAKARAMNERQTIGVRLTPVDGDGFPARWVGAVPPGTGDRAFQIELIQDPGPFRDGWVWATITTPPPPVPAPNTLQPVFNPPPNNAFPINWVGVNQPAPPSGTPATTVYGPFSTTWRDVNGTTYPPQRESFSFGRQVAAGPPPIYEGAVLPGDFLELDGGGQLYGIVDVQGAIAGPPAIPPRLTLNRPLVSDIQVPPSVMPNYRIIRQPRPIPGEQPMKFPEKVAIDLSVGVLHNGEYYVRGLSQGFAWNPNVNPPVGVIDILFSPSGRVVGTSAAADAVLFWVRDTTTGMGDNQGLVVVYTKTGAVLTFPVDQTPPPAGNPYSMVQTGRGGAEL